MPRKKKGSSPRGPSPPDSGDPQGSLFGDRALATGAPTARCKPGPIRVGTSGYSFADWVGPFYPSGTKRSGMLEHYCRYFSTVEINATYYRIPPPQTMQRMAERTPPHFLFTVKLPGALTHKRHRNPEPVEGFRRAIGPLMEAGKYAGALAQFPYSFHRTPEAESYLEWLGAALPETPLFAEFRHASWDGADLEACLHKAGLGFCAVDEPSLSGLFPRRALLVGNTAYVRLHGRNSRDWWSGGSRRYDYLYDEKELEQWSTLITEMATRAGQTFVFFNNCHAGHAVLNARMMEELLGLEREG